MHIKIRKSYDSSALLKVVFYSGGFDVEDTSIANLQRMKKLAGMIKNKHGRIMNVTSMAGFVPGPLMVVYYASKSYLISFSRALATELRNTGVTVTVLCPGLTQTGFSRKVHGQVSDITKNKILSMSADKVADYAFKAMMKGKQVTVPGFMNKLFFVLAGILPVNLATNMVRRSQEKIGKELSAPDQ